MSSETKTSFILIMIFAFLVAFLGIGILSWQYHKMAEKTEGEIHSIKEVVEQRLAEDVLDKFMKARLEKKEEQAKTYFTENTMEQYSQGEFTLINNFVSFEILKTEKLEDEKFRFIIEIQEENKINELIEAVTIIKILDRYYVNSVEFPG